jgi:CRISPR/Cas system-associated exonuclease Cas4 (RecB family)
MSDTDNLLIEPVEFGEMNVLGYNTKYFYICPGAVATFEHLISMNPDEETAGMIRSAAQVADNVFEIEAKVLEDKEASVEQLRQAEILVDDFYDIIHEIDEEVGMIHDVSYMDGHLEKIASYIKEYMEEAGNPCWEGYEQVGTKEVDGKIVPNCVPKEKQK